MVNKIYILLPVHNRREITRLFIRCLKSQTYQNYHLILIDDGSTDGTEEMVKGEITSLTVIKGIGKWWWAGSLQQGYNWLKSQNVSIEDLVLISNDDTVFENDFLEKAVNIINDEHRILLGAVCYKRQDLQLLDKGIHIDWKNLNFEQVSDPEYINCLSTRGLFLRIEDFYEIGGFYPKLLPHYTSDYEFTFRAYKKGMKLVTDSSLKIWVDNTTTGYFFIQPQSFLDFFKKHFSMKHPRNPLTWFAFILLACPWRWKMLSWYKICRGFLYQLFLFIFKRTINA